MSMSKLQLSRRHHHKVFAIRSTIFLPAGTADKTTRMMLIIVSLLSPLAISPTQSLLQLLQSYIMIIC